MATTTTTTIESEYFYSDFLTVLESEPQLYELHTHLLGMGNAGFWIDTILCDQKIMPTNDTFRDDPKLYSILCPLIWKSEESGFVKAEKAAQFVEFLRKNTDIPCDTVLKRNKVKEEIEKTFGDLSSTFWDLIKDDKFNKEQHHRGMTFKNDFSYDVILVLSDLAKGLNIDMANGDDIAQMKIAEKLGIYLSEDTKTIKFQHWIIFNARKKQFEIVYGIRVEDLRKLITVDITSPNEAKRNARAHIVNAFSMCDAQGTPARHVDFHNFRGTFTPEFYPRRFALKDSIYSQRLDILAALIHHVLKRYQTCLPPVKYCEFSVGVGDLSSPWVFDVLRSFPSHQQVRISEKKSRKRYRKKSRKRYRKKRQKLTHPVENQLITETEQRAKTSIYIATKKFSSFAQCVRDNCFPHLQVACGLANVSKAILPSMPNVIYKFLAGFDRRNVQSPLVEKPNDALHLLNDSPHRAILLMRKEIHDSENSITESELFRRKPNPPKESHESNLEKLEKLQREANKIPWFYDWVVGIDLFGDELGYPYCPFVTYPFITYIKDIRNATENGQSIKTRKPYPHFGVRVHCGENVQYADGNAPAYRSFIAHMYIVFCCLRYLRYKLDYGIRIGHGIGFERILGESMSPSKHRKSSVLRAEMRKGARQLFENIAFEVNITSNEYLLGDSLRQGNIAQTHCLNALLDLKAPIILSTDDDGIWPIDRCAFVHPGHHSLTAEYCRAISSNLFKKPEDLKKIIDNSQNFCFFNMGGHLPSIKYDFPKYDIEINTIILHPDLVEHILRRLNRIHKWKEDAKKLLNEAKTRCLTEEEVRFLDEEILRTDLEEKPLSKEENYRRLNDNSEPQDAPLLINAKLQSLDDEAIDRWKSIRRLEEEDSAGLFEKKYILYYPDVPDRYTYDDEKLWREEYQSIAQVAYICSCIKVDITHENKPVMPEEYYWLFKNDCNEEIFNYICKYWKKIYDEFLIFGKKDPSKNYRHVLIKPPAFSFNNNQTSANTTRDEVAFVSLTPRDNKLLFDVSPEIGYIAAQQDRKQRIDIYIDRINIDETNEPWEYLSNKTGLEDLRVTYYTNRDKNKFIYIKSGTSFELAINPNSNQPDEDKKSYLYVLCAYAGAATAALHLIADYINKESQNLEFTEIISTVVPSYLPSKSSDPTQEEDLRNAEIDEETSTNFKSNIA